MPRCAGADAPASKPVLVTTNWMLLETLVALGAAPAGAAQLDAFDRWVGTTAPPASVDELGLRAQPNLALLSQIDPDRILLSQALSVAETRLSRIAPVTVISSYLRPGPLWPNLLAATRKVAMLACRPAAGEQLIQDTARTLARIRQDLPQAARPLLVVQFVGQQHLRVFGHGSLYGAVLEQLGLDNAWSGATNTWGFTLVGVAALLRQPVRDARMVVVEPLPVGLKAQLARNGLWQRLPAVRGGRVLRIPKVWSFGGLPSARRFAKLIADALARPQAHAFQPVAPPDA